MEVEQSSKIQLPAELTDLHGAPDYMWSERSPHAPGVRGLAAMQIAMADRTATHERPLRFDESAQEKEITRSPVYYWPSTIGSLDTLTSGGFYGVSTIVAPSKVGKTLLALGSSLETAAQQKQQVIYFNAELDDSELDERIDEYVHANTHTLDCVGFFTSYTVGLGVTRQDLLNCVYDASDMESPILVVLDSINTIATLNGGNYLDVLRKLGMWAMMSRRISRGAVSFLLVAETNTRGGVKGENLNYWSDLVLRLKPEGDADEEDNLPINMRVTHSRRTPDGRLGLYRRNMVRRRFEQVEVAGEQRALDSAGDGEGDAPWMM